MVVWWWERIPKPTVELELELVLSFVGIVVILFGIMMFLSSTMKSVLAAPHNHMFDVLVFLVASSTFLSITDRFRLRSLLRHLQHSENTSPHPKRTQRTG